MALQLAVVAGAPPAELIALEEGEGVGASLEEIPMPDARPAAVAHAGAAPDALGGHDMRAMAVRSETSALAAASPRPDADADLVQPLGRGGGGDDPTPAALVGAEDLVAAELEDAQAPEHVSGGRFGGVGGARVRYSNGVHSDLQVRVGRVPGCG